MVENILIMKEKDIDKNFLIKKKYKICREFFYKNGCFGKRKSKKILKRESNKI